MSETSESPKGKFSFTETEWGHRFTLKTSDGYAMCGYCGAFENSPEIVAMCTGNPLSTRKAELENIIPVLRETEAKLRKELMSDRVTKTTTEYEIQIQNLEARNAELERLCIDSGKTGNEYLSMLNAEKKRVLELENAHVKMSYECVNYIAQIAYLELRINEFKDILK